MGRPQEMGSHNMGILTLAAEHPLDGLDGGDGGWSLVLLSFTFGDTAGLAAKFLLLLGRHCCGSCWIDRGVVGVENIAVVKVVSVVVIIGC